MIRASFVLFAALGLSAAAAPAATCSGPNPAIVSVAVSNVTTNGSLNTYNIAGTVRNLGSQGQPSNTLQFVDIYQYGNKLDSKGIPPLAAGQSYRFNYQWQRNVEARRGSTPLEFRVRMAQGSDCNPANGVAHLTL
ncbi:MAG: hypothetical protein JO078_08305 [Candidatus Eremiobacteraeota bacterium]|nr:hypothetical protein [Candidatus Eremiobacteraeota bacterium]MBV9056215.1 hypothetical protein [Candidatus Eremiobacteraeota bacterium]MBV9700113.1 hypothetical protein [Candidatus Eremiobacteraeota bacterium]